MISLIMNLFFFNVRKYDLNTSSASLEVDDHDMWKVVRDDESEQESKFRG